MHTEECDYTVWGTPRSVTTRYEAHHGDWLCGMMHTMESDKKCKSWIYAIKKKIFLKCFAGKKKLKYLKKKKWSLIFSSTSFYAFMLRID